MSIDNCASNPFATRRVLLVEDFDVMRGVLRSLLKRCGANQIDTAANAREALLHMQGNKYDVVLCDFNLGPGKNGQNLLEEARHDNLISHATIWIMITAEKTSDMVMGMAEHAPDDYLIKPIVEATLSNRLVKLIERKKALAEIAAAMRAKQYLQALDLCEKRLAQDKTNQLEVLRIQADLCQLTGKNEQARAIYDALLARRSVPWAKLGMAKLSFHDKEYEYARSQLENLIAEHPNFIEAYDWLARALHILGANEASERVLLRAAMLSPNSATRQTALGNAALLCGHADIAEQAMRRAIKLGEQSALKSVDPYLGLARVHSASDRYQEALKVLGEVAQKFSADDVKLQARAEAVRVLHLSGDAQGATEVALDVITHVQGGKQNLSPGATIDLAETFMQMGNCNEASQLLQFVVRNNDEEEDIGARAQAVFDRGGMSADGHALLGQTRQLTREAMNEGVGLLAAGKLSQALECMRAACVQMPRNPRVLLNLAYVLVIMLEKNGWRRDIEDEARKALVLARSIAPGKQRTGELLARLEAVSNLRYCALTSSKSEP